MYSRIFWINKTYPGRLGIMTRPSGADFLEIEMQNIRRAGTDILVSLLEKTEIQKLGLIEEEKWALESNMTFIHHPIPDRSIPLNFDSSLQLVDSLSLSIQQGKNVVLHCRKSIGRSPMMAAAIMVQLGSTPKRAFQQIKKVRNAQVPDKNSQLRWVEEVAANMGTNQKSAPQSFLGKMFGGSF